MSHEKPDEGSLAPVTHSDITQDFPVAPIESLEDVLREVPKTPVLEGALGHHDVSGAAAAVEGVNSPQTRAGDDPRRRRDSAASSDTAHSSHSTETDPESHSPRVSALPVADPVVISRRSTTYSFRFLHNIPTLSPLGTAALVEVIGTFFLVLTVPLSSVQDNELGAFAVGFMLLTMILSMGYLSGGHFNPAVSLAVWLCSVRPDLELQGASGRGILGSDASPSRTRPPAPAEPSSSPTTTSPRAGSQPGTPSFPSLPSGTQWDAAEDEESFSASPYAQFTLVELIVYVLAQLCGGVLASIYAFILFGSEMPIPSYGSSTSKSALMSIFLLYRVLCTEALYTFLICTVVLHVAVNQQKRQKKQIEDDAKAKHVQIVEEDVQLSHNFCSFGVGFTVVAGALAGSAISGGVFNPAVYVSLSMTRCVLTLSSSTCSAPFAALWVYVAGEVIGSIIAAMSYLALLNVVHQVPSSDENHPSGPIETVLTVADDESN